MHVAMGDRSTGFFATTEPRKRLSAQKETRDKLRLIPGLESFTFKSGALPSCKDVVSQVGEDVFLLTVILLATHQTVRVGPSAVSRRQPSVIPAWCVIARG